MRLRRKSPDRRIPSFICAFLIFMRQSSWSIAGPPSLMRPHLVHRHEDGTEEWMALFEDNEGRPLGRMTQVERTRVEQLADETIR